MTNDEFEKQLECGRRAEELVDHVLRDDGSLVLRSSDLSGPNGGHAPCLYGRAGRLILPDRQAFKAGSRRWVEVKRKSTATHHNLSDVWEHGFGRRLWSQYESVEAETATPLWLFVYEDNTGCLLHAILGDLEPSHIYSGNKMDWGGTVFFRRDDFIPYGYDPTLRVKFSLPEPTHVWDLCGPCRLNGCSPATLEHDPEPDPDWDAYLADCDRYGWDPYEEEP